MIEMKLPDMSCGHCASTVTKACQGVDPAAKVEVDLGARTVRIESGEDREKFANALAEEGYPPAG